MEFILFFFTFAKVNLRLVFKWILLILSLNLSNYFETKTKAIWNHSKFQLEVNELTNIPRIYYHCRLNVNETQTNCWTMNNLCKSCIRGHKLTLHSSSKLDLHQIFLLLQLQFITFFFLWYFNQKVKWDSKSHEIGWYWKIRNLS